MKSWVTSKCRGLARGLLAVAACGAILVAAGASKPDSGKALSSLHIGFSNPQGENTYLGPLGQAVKKTVEAAGAKYTEISAQVNPDKQISDIQTLISSGVNVLIVYPLDAKALQPVLKQAAKQGIAVVGFNADLAAEIGSPPASPYVGQLFDGFPSKRFVAAQVALVKALVRSGEVLYVGLGIPVPALELYSNNVVQGLKQADGIDFVGRVDSPGDDPASAVAPIAAALARHPRLKGIVTLSDAYALGAAQALKSVGREGDVVVISSQLQDTGWKGIRDGSIAASWDFQNILLGKALGKLALAAGAGTDKASFQTTVQPGVVKVDKSNIDSHKNWQQLLKELR